ncbi:hypothetical protein EVJ50_12485 [Synechococcus sp. RSCCF101]|uniref:hypothetical protein n=1 Tax=Synechococcus sp. RSCCF101 TaxID=2511069 RepID=UPI0012467234|nr:hypothetical protein [Synechococcus sp. RSCCF101]QEY32925.1 hypothetical protein EVJ50_12485 [Synechococcus sp. RSCCF101]
MRTLALGATPLIALATLAAPAARASLLAPVLQLMRPRLERHLSEQCTRLVSDGDAAIGEAAAEPCRALARPASECLIRQTSRSGRELGVMRELMAGRIGDDTEAVIKLCAAELLGLPAESLQALPLDQLLPRDRR